MKRQSILSILLLLLTLLICCGCGGSGKSAEPRSAAATTEETAEQIPEEAAVVEEAAAKETVTEAAADIEGDIAVASEEKAVLEAAESEASMNVENVVGIFEGLEDNHTALFSFEGAEIAFYFEDPAVQNVLYEAVLGSPYTLSYTFDSTLGLDVIYKISE